MKFYQAEEVEQIEMLIGESIKLESLRQAVVPPYLMLLPFLDLPTGLELIQEKGLDEDGVHGVTYTIRANSILSGELTIGFKDMRTQQVTHKKVIKVRVYEPE